jgi:hypothetical protein
MRNNLPPQLQLTHLDHGLFDHPGHQPLLLVKFDFSRMQSRFWISEISTLIDVLKVIFEIMSLDPEEYWLLQETIEGMPTSRLHLLNCLLEDDPARADVLAIVQLELKKRRQQVQIEKLNKSLKESNPVGRVISGVKGFFIRSSRKS